MNFNTCLAAFILAFALPLTAADRWTYESPLELFTVGDFDGDALDDLVIVEKASGVLQLQEKIQSENGQWRAPASPGFSNVTSVASGRLLSTTRDALAFTSPEANRINLLSLAAFNAPWLVDNRYPTNHGPVTLAALDIGGAGNNAAVDDLYLGSIWNGATPNFHTTLRNDLLSLSTLGNLALGNVPARANPVRVKTGLPLHAAVLLRGGASDTLLVSSNYAGVPSTSASVAALAGSDYIAAPFETNSPLARFVLWQPGLSNIQRFPITELTANNFAFGAATTFPLGVPVGSVFSLPGAAGLRLLVIHSGGATESVYDWDGTTTAPVLVLRTNAPDGETFTGAMPLGGFGFMSLSSNDGSGRTTTARATRWNGSAYTNGPATTLPSLAHFAGQANVLLFQSEPFVAPSPGLLAARNASDWSSGVKFAPSVTATQETYLSGTAGVGTPVQVALGSTPVGTGFGMGNQVSNFMSLFSLTRPVGDVVSDVRIDPAPGVYDAAVTVTLTPRNAAHQVWFRLNNTGNWTLYSASFVVSATTTVTYYGKPAAGTARSVVKSAAYTITTPPVNLDSDGDGVPDYVERNIGLDPTRGRDNDGDGWSDLEELVYGTDPNSAASRPGTAATPVSLNAGFLLEARPKPRDPISDQVVKSDYGTIVRVHQLPGGFVGEQTVELPAERAARFSNVVADVSQRLLALSTEPHFDIETTNSDTRLGRELLTLLPIPGYAPMVVSNALYTGVNATADASNWIAAAIFAVTSAPPRVVAVDFVKFDTLAALLTERKFGELLFARGTNWGTNLTLFPHRAVDVTRSNAPIEVLRGLERYSDPANPAHRLTSIYNTIDAGVESAALSGVNALKTLVTELYRISMLSNNAAPGVYPLPADALRDFIAGGPVHSNYAPVITFTSNQTVSARAGVSNLLAAPLPRPVTNVVLRVRADYCGEGVSRLALFDNLTSGGITKLVDEAGQPFLLPQAFVLLPGSELAVFAFTDAEVSSAVPSSCRSNVLEVILAGLLVVPVASDPDRNGNLLIDSWEAQFFGGLPNGPFLDADGDGYQNLQEMLAGTDPEDILSLPAVPPVMFARPMMQARRLPNGFVALRWTWPAPYAGSFFFGLREADNVLLPFSEIAVAFSLDGDEFTVVVPPSAALRFYNLVVRLR